MAGRHLTLAIDSDLGDVTKLRIGITRIYQKQGSTERYPVAYVEEASTVGEWRTPRTIHLDDARWAARIHERQRISAAGGEPFTVGMISDSIEIDFVVPVNQDPPFERWNANLDGVAVTQSGDLRVVRHTVLLDVPLGVQFRDIAYADPLGLEPGKRYRASRQVTLMPAFEPEDAGAAIEAIRLLEPRTAFTVIETREKIGSPWYRVRTVIGEGWINSIALIGQTVTSVP